METHDHKCLMFNIYHEDNRLLGEQAIVARPEAGVWQNVCLKIVRKRTALIGGYRLKIAAVSILRYKVKLEQA